ncbi:hypothetical protein SLA2020_041130 [Shorea laevis]
MTTRKYRRVEMDQMGIFKLFFVFFGYSNKSHNTAAFFQNPATSPNLDRILANLKSPERHERKDRGKHYAGTAPGKEIGDKGEMDDSRMEEQGAQVQALSDSYTTGAQRKYPGEVEHSTHFENEKFENHPLEDKLGSMEPGPEPATANQTPGDDNTCPHVYDISGENIEGKSEGDDGVGPKDDSKKSLTENADKMEDENDGQANVLCVSPIFTHLTQDIKAEDDDEEEMKDSSPESEVKKQVSLPELGGTGRSPKLCFDNSGAGTEEEQAAFAKKVEAFYKEKNLEFKHPKFYKEDINLLKLWRAVIELGGYEQVTSCKLWRQVGESFNPPKTCTTVSWTFRNFYEKALLDYEKHKIHDGELTCPVASFPESNGAGSQAGSNQVIGSGSGRARRDAAARAMQGWHSQRLLGNGEVCHPIIKDKSPSPSFKGLPKRKRPSTLEHAVQSCQFKSTKPQLDTMVIDIGPPAEWVKFNVQKLNDCFEVYGLIPGLLRDEVHVQSDPAGQLVISGQPKQLDNPWGVTPFKKVVSLPSRIDPHQISAVVTLHGQLFIRVPFKHSEF